MLDLLTGLMRRPSSGAYSIARSLRFNSADNAYLSRTPGSAGNRRTFTWSGWVKRASLASAQAIFSAFTDSTNYFEFYFGPDDALYYDSDYGAGGDRRTVKTSGLFRDPAAWYHFVLAVDTTQATAGNRIRVYINGVETSFSTYVNGSGNWPQNTQLPVNNTGAHNMGRRASDLDHYAGMFLAEVHFVDGSQLTPSSFGQTDSTTGQWVPKKVIGVTYGTNGFYLNFSDNSNTTAATLGKDSSGNGNNWTPNSFSVTAGVGNDSLTDTPTNNYCVFNKLTTVTTATLTNGNLDASASAVALGSFGLSSGQHYWEITSTGGTTTCGMHNGSATSTTTVTTGTTKGFRFDADAGTFDWTSDGSSWTSIATGLTSGPYFPYVSTAAATTASLNAGQRTLAYTAPTGYKTLCTSNLTTPAIVKPSSYFDIDTYTGTGATRSKTGLGFQPDLVWFKGRSGATAHALYDSVRGVQKDIAISTAAETTEATGLTAFNSDGYTIGTLAKLNTNAATYAAWLWKKGVTPGFDIVSYTGNATNRTVAHALGVAPKMIIVHNRHTGTSDWQVWHTGIAGTDYLLLNTTGAKGTAASAWNSTTPTSSVFSLGTNADTNGSGNSIIAYLFAEIAGFSKFGTYTGNGSTDGPFVYCGFRPRYIMVKNTNAASQWVIYDTARDTYNVASTRLRANASDIEGTNAIYDILSNGFKVRGLGTDYNDANTYIFAAFAEAPFKYANAR